MQAEKMNQKNQNVQNELQTYIVILLSKIKSCHWALEQFKKQGKDSSKIESNILDYQKLIRSHAENMTDSVLKEKILNIVKAV